MKNVLITGGAGFIGSRLALVLLGKGYTVRVLDNLSPQIHGENPRQSPLFRSIEGRVDFQYGSVTQKVDVEQALAGIDIVVHLAAETGTGQSMYAIGHYVDVNVGGTAILLDLIANQAKQVKKIIVASSRAIYGEGKYRCAEHGVVYPAARSSAKMEQGHFEPTCPRCGLETIALPTDETTPSCPSSIYGVTKLTQEQLVLTSGAALGISAIAYRYQNVFGPGQSLSNPYTGILSIFSTRIRNGSDINIFEDGLESRDFVYIDDVIAATMAGIEHSDTLVGAFNVGSGEATSVLTVTQLLQEQYGIDVPVAVTGQFRIGDIRHNFADLNKIKTELGFSPKTKFRDGLKQFTDWVKTEALAADRYEESLQELKERGLFK